MPLSAGIIGLVALSVISSVLLIASLSFALRVIRHWDISSGSLLQLSLERRTYLLSTIMSYVFALELVGGFLFIYTVDDLHNLFIGAMCSAGVLNVNSYGYPTLIFKIVILILAGLWLIMNAVDTNSYDYPLIKQKYTLLLIITPFVLASSTLQGLFFLQMKPDVITSCCSGIFTSEAELVTSTLIALPPKPLMWVFYLTSAGVIGVGILSLFKKSFYLAYGILSACYLAVALLSVISFISVYYYELPHHHCPFCILQKEYNYIGYPLYLSLFVGVITGIGSAIVSYPQKNLSEYAKKLRDRLVLTSLISILCFVSLSSYPILFSEFRLFT